MRSNRTAASGVTWGKHKLEDLFKSLNYSALVGERNPMPRFSVPTHTANINYE